MITCGHCDKPFDNYEQYSRHLEMRQCLKKETKMTREEAVKKFYQIMYGDDKYHQTNEIRNRMWAEKTIDAYEALGLIKFDEEEDINYRELHSCGITLLNIEALCAKGYKIVKDNSK